MKDLQSIFKKYPKAKKGFERFFRTGFKSDMPQTKWEGFLANFYSVNLNSQIGWILAWMRSEYWINFEVAKGRNSSEYSLTLYTGQSKSEYIKTDGEFNEAFLSLTEQFCKQIEK